MDALEAKNFILLAGPHFFQLTTCTGLEFGLDKKRRPTHGITASGDGYCTVPRTKMQQLTMILQFIQLRMWRPLANLRSLQDTVELKTGFFLNFISNI